MKCAGFFGTLCLSAARPPAEICVNNNSIQTKTDSPVTFQAYSLRCNPSISKSSDSMDIHRFIISFGIICTKKHPFRTGGWWFHFRPDWMFSILFYTKSAEAVFLSAYIRAAFRFSIRHSGPPAVSYHSTPTKNFVPLAKHCRNCAQASLPTPTRLWKHVPCYSLYSSSWQTSLIWFSVRTSMAFSLSATRIIIYAKSFFLVMNA